MAVNSGVLHLMSTACEKYGCKIQETAYPKEGKHCVSLSLPPKINMCRSGETVGEARRKVYKELYNWIEFCHRMEVFKTTDVSQEKIDFNKRWEMLEEVRNKPPLTCVVLEYSKLKLIDEFQAAAAKANICIDEQIDPRTEEPFFRVSQIDEEEISFDDRWEILEKSKTMPGGTAVRMEYSDEICCDELYHKAKLCNVYAFYKGCAILLVKLRPPEVLVDDFFISQNQECNIRRACEMHFFNK